MTISHRARVVQDMPACPHCGCDIAPTPKKGFPRSVPQHRRMFALFRAAWMHWPERHQFKPSNSDHLRAWLTAKTGYRSVLTIDTANMTGPQAIASASAALKAAGAYPFVDAVDGKLHITTANSINFDTLPHLAACELFDSIAEIIEAETGIRCDDMIKSTQRKSGREPRVTT